MKKFLQDLEKELRKLNFSDEEIKEILADHEEMIEVAQNEGVEDEKLTEKFGNPEKLASDIYKSSIGGTSKMNEKVMGTGDTAGYSLFKSLPVLDEVKEVKIKLISEDLKFYPYDGENIEVYFKKVKDEDFYEVSYNDGVFQLNRDKSSKLLNMFSFGGDSGHIIVKVPTGIELNKFNVNVVSGDIEVNSITSKGVQLKSTSGDIELENIKVEKGEITTVSGDIELVDFYCKGNLSLSSVSGDYEVSKGSVEGDFVLHTVSGDFEIENVKAEYSSLQSVSGDIKGTEFYPTKVDLKSVSGDISIKNNDKSHKIEVGRKKTLSGDISIK